MSAASAARTNSAASVQQALRLRRGDCCFLLPTPWVRGLVRMGTVHQLPRARPWVCGIAIHEKTPLPVIDLAASVGRPPAPFGVGVLFGAADSGSIVLLATDEPGRFVSVNVAGALSHGGDWLIPRPDLGAGTWWVDGEILAGEYRR